MSKKKSQTKSVQKSAVSNNAEFEEIDDADMDMGDFDDIDMDQSPLFWSMKLDPNDPKQIQEPSIPGYIVHITNACFGVSVKNNSRTVIIVNPSDDDNDTSLQTPLCVLRQGHHENHSLDLLFNEAANLSLKGKNVSAVYLTGYIQPPPDTEQDELDPRLEDMDNEELIAALKQQRRGGMDVDQDYDRAPQLANDDDDDDDVDDDDVDADADVYIQQPAQKKQKTSGGSKATKKQNDNISTKKRKTKSKSPERTDKKTSKSKSNDDNNDDIKDNNNVSVIEKDPNENNKKKKNKKNKKKSMSSMKGGIKYRDMKIGSGRAIEHGNKVSCFYVGQTSDKKVFDKKIGGDPFQFDFGNGSVIKGWDLGLKGMKVGGKRKLIIPSKFGYGVNGAPDNNIPPNAELTFTIEIKSVQ